MIVALHLAAAQPIERDVGLQLAAIGPEIEDAYLGLRQAKWRLDEMLKAHALLQKKFAKA